MSRDQFILEIGCEELPPKRLKRLSHFLADNLRAEIEKAELTVEKITPLAAPRRLAVKIEGLPSALPPKTIERQGPSVKAAYDANGMPTIACLGFAKSCGVSVDQLSVKDTEKGQRVFCQMKMPAKKIIECLPDFVSEALKKIPMSKPMRWGRHAHYFIRPVHWILALFGSEIVPVTFFGLTASNKTYGHRFHHPNAIVLAKASEYESLLASQGHVMVNFEKRKENIRQAVEEKAKPYGTPVIRDALLDEVTAMVEWPTVWVGQFNPEFLRVPKEVLVTAMESHQKYFSIVDSQGQLVSHFILVSNIESKAPEKVIKGNERVLQARLSDAAFFYHKDCETPLTYHQKALANVLFQKQLGTLADKTKRLQKLAGFIAKQLADLNIKIDLDKTKQAASLSKCDLLTDMVGEFPELQGIMGGYYALHDKENKVVAEAIRDQYKPRFSQDTLPVSHEACALALADRLDTLVGIIGINKLPTADKDPYGLRRAALGIVRILIEKQLPLNISTLLKQAVHYYAEALPNKKVFEQAEAFILERLRYWYLDQKNILPEVFAAVSANEVLNFVDFDKRIEAVNVFLTMQEASALAQANKRVTNILKKQAKIDIPKKANERLFELDSEKALYKSLEAYQKRVAALYDKADYAKALSALAGLKVPVDDFFDQVMIMVDDKKTRENRLALLVSLRKLFTQVADISLLP